MSFRPTDPEAGADSIVAEINVTPLTDIFLVLLIIFMVTSTAMFQQGAPVSLPAAGAGDAEVSGVTVTLTADRELSVNGTATAMDALEPVLRAALGESALRQVVLRGDRRVVLEDAVYIMTVAKRAGAERMAIATEPEAGGAGR